MPDLTAVPWTAFDDGEIWAGEEQVGSMATIALAEEACAAHNAALAAREAAARGVHLHGAAGTQFGHGNTQFNQF